MRQALWAIVLLGGCGASESGGGIPWRGKGEDVKAVMAEAKAAGKPMMLFFSSEG
jgi:hypothetical protein